MFIDVIADNEIDRFVGQRNVQRIGDEIVDRGSFGCSDSDGMPIDIDTDDRVEVRSQRGREETARAANVDGERFAPIGNRAAIGQNRQHLFDFGTLVFSVEQDRRIVIE